ncbi:MAG: hypothetical protein ABIT83_03105, partial [Massilia sp.]
DVQRDERQVGQPEPLFAGVQDLFHCRHYAVLAAARARKSRPKGNPYACTRIVHPGKATYTCITFSISIFSMPATQPPPVTQRAAPLSRAPDAPLGAGCLLLPVRRATDVDAALRHVQTVRGDGPLKLIFLHVAAGATGAPGVHPEDDEAGAALLAHVAAHCALLELSYDSFIVGGDPVFAILDTAEMLGCERIVLRLGRRRGLLSFFSPETVRQVTSRRRDVPVVLVDAYGALIEDCEQ